jgi:hypothetical protein
MNSSIPLSERLTFWLLWVVGTAVAGVIGWTAAVGLGYITLGLGTIAFGVTVGGMIGAVQGAMLVWYVRRFNNPDDWPVLFFGWMISTILGMYFCLAIVLSLIQLELFEPDTSQGRISLSHLLFTAFLYAVGGIAYGFIQWIPLRQFVKNARLWLPIASLGWAVAAVLAIIATDSFMQSAFPGYELGNSIVMTGPEYWSILVQGTIGAAMFGLVSATALALLVRPPALHSQEQLSTPSQPQRIADPS